MDLTNLKFESISEKPESYLKFQGEEIPWRQNEVESFRKFLIESKKRLSGMSSSDVNLCVVKGQTGSGKVSTIRSLCRILNIKLIEYDPFNLVLNTGQEFDYSVDHLIRFLQSSLSRRSLRTNTTSNSIIGVNKNNSSNKDTNSSSTNKTSTTTQNNNSNNNSISLLAKPKAEENKISNEKIVIGSRRVKRIRSTYNYDTHESKKSKIIDSSEDDLPGVEGQLVLVYDLPRGILNCKYSSIYPLQNLIKEVMTSEELYPLVIVATNSCDDYLILRRILPNNYIKDPRCLSINLKEITKKQMMTILKLNKGNQLIDHLIEISSGDIRYLMNNMQFYCKIESYNTSNTTGNSKDNRDSNSSSTNKTSTTTQSNNSNRHFTFCSIKNINPYSIIDYSEEDKDIKEYMLERNNSSNFSLLGKILFNKRIPVCVSSDPCDIGNIDENFNSNFSNTFNNMDTNIINTNNSNTNNNMDSNNNKTNNNVYNIDNSPNTDGNSAIEIVSTIGNSDNSSINTDSTASSTPIDANDSTNKTSSKNTNNTDSNSSSTNKTSTTTQSNQSNYMDNNTTNDSNAYNNSIDNITNISNINNITHDNNNEYCSQTMITNTQCSSSSESAYSSCSSCTSFSNYSSLSFTGSDTSSISKYTSYSVRFDIEDLNSRFHRLFNMCRPVDTYPRNLNQNTSTDSSKDTNKDNRDSNSSSTNKTSTTTQNNSNMKHREREPELDLELVKLKPSGSQERFTKSQEIFKKHRHHDRQTRSPRSPKSPKGGKKDKKHNTTTSSNTGVGNSDNTNSKDNNNNSTNNDKVKEEKDKDRENKDSNENNNTNTTSSNKDVREKIREKIRERIKQKDEKRKTHKIQRMNAKIKIYGLTEEFDPRRPMSYTRWPVLRPESGVEQYRQSPSRMLPKLTRPLLYYVPEQLIESIKSDFSFFSGIIFDNYSDFYGHIDDCASFTRHYTCADVLYTPLKNSNDMDISNQFLSICIRAAADSNIYGLNSQAKGFHSFLTHSNIKTKSEHIKTLFEDFKGEMSKHEDKTMYSKDALFLEIIPILSMESENFKCEWNDVEEQEKENEVKNKIKNVKKEYKEYKIENKEINREREKNKEKVKEGQGQGQNEQLEQQQELDKEDQKYKHKEFNITKNIKKEEEDDFNILDVMDKVELMMENGMGSKEQGVKSCRGGSIFTRKFNELLQEVGKHYGTNENLAYGRMTSDL